MNEKLKVNYKGIKKTLIITIISMLSLIMLISCGVKNDKSNEITISIAASLSEPMNEIKREYEKDNNVILNLNVGGSGTLKRQIAQGADVDLYFSANEKYVNELIDEGLIFENRKFDVLTNSLVLIKNKKVKVDISDISQLKDTKLTIAIGEPDTVPAGQYAKEALIKNGLWDSIKNNLILAKDVKGVVTYVESGNVDLGIVYNSDVDDLKNSKIELKISPKDHELIKYSLGIINSSNKISECEGIVEFLYSEKARAIFKKYGFD